jgi:uncharacterized protein YqcC (DUF446 family)
MNQPKLPYKRGKPTHGVLVDVRQHSPFVTDRIKVQVWIQWYLPQKKTAMSGCACVSRLKALRFVMVAIKTDLAYYCYGKIARFKISGARSWNNMM